MQIFIEGTDLNIWEAIEIGPYILTMVAEKPREQWDEEEKKLVQYNLKAKNIITSAFGMDNTLGYQIAKVQKICGIPYK